MNRNLAILVVTSVVLVAVQVLIFRHFVAFGVGFCFLYVMALLFLPQEIGFVSAMVIGLILGLLVDIFYNTIGIHAAASVLVMFIRPYWMNINKPRSGYEINDLPMITHYGLGWFVSYSFPLIFIHSLMVFMLESGGGVLIGVSLLKTIATTIITLVFMVSIQYLFYNKSKR